MLEDDYNFDLGSHHYPITTSSSEAQKWFNRGVIWTFGFNHEEAVVCFEKAKDHDPTCAMAYWGIAYSLGPNYNKPWEFFEGQELITTVQRVQDAAAQANANLDGITDVERALIQALWFRYPQGKKQEDEPGSKDFSIWNVNYANAMQSVYERFGNDLTVATLYADAQMNLRPWGLWDLHTGLPAEGAPTLIIKDVLERAMGQAGGNDHPGLLHLYIHAMEMSSTPEIALSAADRLRGLVPDSGHLQHMPSHIYVLCGDYRGAVASNSDAIHVDQKYLVRAGALNFYTLYRAHNYHFRIYAAMFAGQSKVALDTIDQLEASIPEELLHVHSPPMGDWLEGFLAMRVHALVRFGRWEEIIGLHIPKDQNLYCVTTAMHYYAKGIAYAVLGDITGSREQRSLFQTAVGRVPSTRTLFNNKCVDLLAIAAAMLDGELEYRQANFDVAFAHLRNAIKLDDSLPYDEPWGWMQPTRHAYGALLLEQDRVSEAAEIYAADLGYTDKLPRVQRRSNNVWSLHGYHECLMRLGRQAEASIVAQQLRLAIAVADVPIKSSCFCRLKTAQTI